MTNLKPLLKAAGVVPLADLFVELGLNRHERRRLSVTSSWPTVAVVPVQVDQPPTTAAHPRVFRIARKDGQR